MKKSNLKWLLQAVLFAVLLVAVSAATVSASENLTVHFIDVGQGDSELLQFAGKNVLIDGGIPEMGSRVESYLRAHGVSSLYLVVATHPHDDHMAGYSMSSMTSASSRSWTAAKRIRRRPSRTT